MNISNSIEKGILRILQQLVLAAFISLVMCGCSNAAEKNNIKPTATTKGAQQGMKTYYIGRFAIDVPAEFKLAVQSQKIRYAEVSDFIWKSGDRAKERDSLWANKIAEIKTLPKPKSKQQIIIEEKSLKGIGFWAKAVEYYGDKYVTEDLYWTVLVDFGDAGMWLTLDGEDNDMSIKNFTNILTHYDYGLNRVTRESFCLNYGKIDLPYLEQEKAYARFEGHPLGLKLEIHMSEIHQEVETGLIQRLVAAVATNFVPGLDVNKIRSTTRSINCKDGEEIVVELDEGNRKELRFGWEYAGKKDSGENPSIRIEMEAPEGNTSGKLAIWDQVVGSFRPANR